MKNNRNTGIKLVVALIATSMITSGCANLSAVRTFADETKKMSAAFDPMLTGSTVSCIDKYMRKKLITSTNFDPAFAEKAAKELCGPIDEDNKVISELNSLLEQYADTLAALADDKLPLYKSELDGLASSLGKVKKAGSQESLVNADKLGAVTALTDFLSRIATQHLQKAAICDLLNHESAIMTATNALNDYATLNYRAWLNDERREIDILRKSLDSTAKSEPLAANYLKTILLSEERQVEKRDKAIDAFVKSIAQLQKSNSEIRQKFDKLDDKELLAQLNNFANEVTKLRKQIQSAF